MAGYGGLDDEDFEANEDMQDNEDDEGGEGSGNQRPLPSKTLIVFLLDCHPNMHLEYKFRNDGDDSENVEEDAEYSTDTYFRRACGQLRKLCREKLKQGQMDHVGLVLFNSHDTNNKWNHESCKTEIELKELGKETIDHLAHLISGKEKVTAHSERVDKLAGKSHLELGLSCSTSLINESDMNAQKSIYILTCNDDIAGSSREKLQENCLQKVKDCVEQGITIDVWPLHDAHSLTDDAPMPPKFKSTTFFQKLLGLCIDESSILAENVEQEVQERLEERSLDNLGVEIEALKSRSQASLEWTIVPSSEQAGTPNDMPLKIAVQLFSLALEAKKPNAAKIYKPTNQPTTTITTRLCQTTGKVLDAQQVESYFPFGGETVVLSKEDQEKIKTMSIPKGIMTLGFAPREKVVKPEHNLRPCWLMRPDDKKAKNSCTTFRAFHKVLLDKDEVALCCIRKRANDAPRLHALVPQAEVRQDRDILAPEGFHVIPLPFADDLRNLPPGFSIQKEDEADDDAVKCAEKLVKRVSAGGGLLQHIECGLGLVNPSLLKHFAHVEALALGMNVDEEDPVTNLKEAKILLDPPKWFSEGKRGPQLKETAESMKSAIAENYDYLLGSKAGGSKRKRESDPVASAKAAAKKEDAENKLAGMDWHAMLAGGTLKKATVPQLKAYCATHGLKGTGKKDDLLAIVEKHLEGA